MDTNKKGFFKRDILISDEDTIEGYTFLNTVEGIKENQLFDILKTKPYGDHPGFCTLDYYCYDDKKDFKPGYCADTGFQYRSSLYSYLVYQGFKIQDRDKVLTGEDVNKRIFVKNN